MTGDPWNTRAGFAGSTKDLMPNNCIKLDVGLHSANLTDRCMKAIGQ